MPNVTLYRNYQPKNSTARDFDNAITFSAGGLRNESTVINPIIRISSTTNIARHNYAYIDDFGRYYFITDIKTVRIGLWEVYMHVDVLYTYWRATISTSPCIVSRNAGKRMFDLVDDQIYATADKLFSVTNSSLQPFKSSTVSTNWVLTVTGLGEIEDEEPTSGG